MKKEGDKSTGPKPVSPVLLELAALPFPEQMRRLATGQTVIGGEDYSLRPVGDASKENVVGKITNPFAISLKVLGRHLRRIQRDQALEQAFSRLGSIFAQGLSGGKPQQAVSGLVLTGELMEQIFWYIARAEFPRIMACSDISIRENWQVVRVLGLEMEKPLFSADELPTTFTADITRAFSGEFTPTEEEVGLTKLEGTVIGTLTSPATKAIFALRQKVVGLLTKNSVFLQEVYAEAKKQRIDAADVFYGKPYSELADNAKRSEVLEGLLALFNGILRVMVNIEIPATQGKTVVISAGWEIVEVQPDEEEETTCSCGRPGCPGS